MIYTKVSAVSQVIIQWVMDHVILKTLENRLKEKVGQTVQSLDIISHAGVYRGTGNWLKNVEKLRCCQMAPGNEITSKMLRDACHSKS